MVHYTEQYLAHFNYNITVKWYTATNSLIFWGCVIVIIMALVGDDCTDIFIASNIYPQKAWKLPSSELFYIIHFEVFWLCRKLSSSHYNVRNRVWKEGSMWSKEVNTKKNPPLTFSFLFTLKLPKILFFDRHLNWPSFQSLTFDSRFPFDNCIYVLVV